MAVASTLFLSPIKKIRTILIYAMPYNIKLVVPWFGNSYVTDRNSSVLKCFLSFFPPKEYVLKVKILLWHVHNFLLWGFFKFIVTISPTVEILRIYFLRTIFRRKYLPKISAVGLFSYDKFEETPKQKVINMSKLNKFYFSVGVEGGQLSKIRRV